MTSWRMLVNPETIWGRLAATMFWLGMGGTSVAIGIMREVVWLSVFTWCHMFGCVAMIVWIWSSPMDQNATGVP